MTQRRQKNLRVTKRRIIWRAKQNVLVQGSSYLDWQLYLGTGNFPFKFTSWQGVEFLCSFNKFQFSFFSCKIKYHYSVKGEKGIVLQLTFYQQTSTDFESPNWKLFVKFEKHSATCGANSNCNSKFDDFHTTCCLEVELKDSCSHGNACTNMWIISKKSLMKWWLHTSQVAHQAGAYPGFCSMKPSGFKLKKPG